MDHQRVQLPGLAAIPRRAGDPADDFRFAVNRDPADFVFFQRIFDFFQRRPEIGPGRLPVLRKPDHQYFGCLLLPGEIDGGQADDFLIWGGLVIG
jgi:hypothetical protein